MKELWNRTFELFRRHIVLWVPCSIAGILMLVMAKLQRVEIHWLLRIFSTQHSVLGGEIPVADLAQARHRAMMLIYPSGSVKQFLEVCAFVVALVMTKNLVHMVIDEQRPDMIAAVRGVLPRYREVLLLSVKYMAVLAVFGGIFVVLGSSPLTSNRIHDLFLSKGFIYVFGLLAQASLAWLLVPSAIRLLQPREEPISSIKGRRLGTAFAVATSACALGLEYLLGKVETGAILEKQWEGEAIAVVNTLVTNLPEVLLFIALTLIAMQVREEVLPAEPEISWGSRFSDWLRKAREWGSGPI